MFTAKAQRARRTDLEKPSVSNLRVLCVLVVKVNSSTEQQSAQTLVFNPELALKFECSID